MEDYKLYLRKCPICGSESLQQITLRKGFIFKKDVPYLKCNHCNALIRLVPPDKVKIEKFDIDSYWYMKPLLNKTLTIQKIEEVSQYYQVYGYILIKLFSGDFSGFSLHPEKSPPILLKRGEEVLVYADNISYYEPRRYTVRVYSGSSHKVSDGWWSRSGMSYPVQMEELKFVDKGFFVITNKRIIFGGYKRSITVPLSKMTYVLPYKKDGITIGKDSRQKPYCFSGFSKETIEITIENKVFSYNLTSKFIIALLYGLTKRTNK